MIKHLTRPSLGYHLTLVQHPHNVGDFAQIVNFTGDNKDSRLFDLGQPLEKLPAAKGIHLTGRIIHNQNSRISHNRRGNCQPLDLTTGKALGTQIQLFNQPHLRGNFFNPFLNQSFSHSLINQVKGDFIGNRVCQPA